ncbi:MAG: hypothetical protein JNL19_00585 [Burkholderiales bacterium]|nr:hypothetical protein [Burkholderiales bacterium]
MQLKTHRAMLATMIGTLLAALHTQPAHAQTCPFDQGASDAVNDGVVLTRYALNMTGATLVAGTKYAALDPANVRANIECMSCGLDMNGDGTVDTTDATIIARHLAGIKGSAVADGLSLGTATSASRSTSAAVVSFLANGCQAGGPISAFVQGGNAFGAPAVLGTTDGNTLTVTTGANNGVRLSTQLADGAFTAINVISGAAGNAATGGAVGATIAGGGTLQSGTPISNAVSGSFGSVGGGLGNTAGPRAVVAGGDSNTASAYASAILGGSGNSATATLATVAGGADNTATAASSTIIGGRSNQANGFDSVTLGGSFARTQFTGQVAHAAGAFLSVPGTAQSSAFVLRNRTTTATATELFLDGASQRLLFPADRAAALEIQLIAKNERTDLLETAHYTFRCTYGRVSAPDVADIRPAGCGKTEVQKDALAWDANVVLGADKSFQVQVTGVAGQNIRWVATVRATEVAQ